MYICYYTLHVVIFGSIHVIVKVFQAEGNMNKIWQSICGYVESLWMDGSYGEQFKHWCFGERKVERLNTNITGNGSGNGRSNVNGKGVVIVMVMVYDNIKIKQLSVVLYI